MADYNYNPNEESVNLCRFIGQTVTIFTTSGGIGGSGFTGVLMSANDCFVRLLTKIGAAPECPVGNTCCPPNRGGYIGGYGGFGSVGFGTNGAYYGTGLGSVVIIPIDRITSFVHNAI